MWEDKQIMTTTIEEIKNNFTNLCSFKIETNSKGHNTTLHGYDGASDEVYQKTIDQVIKWHNYAQDKLNRETKE